MSGTVAAVILAAGRSTRMQGQNKLLADSGGEAVVVRVVSAALASAADQVIAVTGHEAEKVKKALAGFDVRFIDNPDYSGGLSTSLKAGIAAVGEETQGALILLGDMPRVSSGLIDILIERFQAEGAGAICRPVFEGRPGNPVLWPRDLFAEIMAIEGDTGARGLFGRFPERIVEVETGDSAIHFDVDIPSDLDK